MSYKDYFNDKRIAVIGLGPHGEMMADIKFLSKTKASVSIYDMRSEKRLKNILPDLKDLKLDKTIFGSIDSESLINYDLIIISPEISKKSFFLKKAISAEIQIEFPETLFFKLSPPITLVGVVGQYGKSSVSKMIYAVLKRSFALYKDQGIFLIDPDSSSGALVHLRKIKKDDVVVARIPEQLMNYYTNINISPHVAVITSVISFGILNSQTYNNFIIAPDNVVDIIKEQKNFPSKAKILRTRGSMIPNDWDIDKKILHNRDNLALVLQAAELFKVNPELVKETTEELPIIKGCMEFVKKVNQVEFFNDAHSVTPESTISAIRSIYSTGKRVVLIMGGAYTGYDYSDLIKVISEHVHHVILLSGSGTLGIRLDLNRIDGLKVTNSISLDDAVRFAFESSEKGDRILFSPAFDAVGIDISRKERGEKFVKIVRSL